MSGVIIFIHTVICIFLVVVILMQSGRGGGLTEGFSSAESMFGAQTNTFLTKSTTVLSVIFFLTCLGLALLSFQKEKSLMNSAVVSQETVKESQSAAGQQMEPAGEMAAEEASAMEAVDMTSETIQDNANQAVQPSNATAGQKASETAAESASTGNAQ